MELTPAQREQRRQLLARTLDALATLPDPGKVYDTIDINIFAKAIPSGFMGELEPLNWLIGVAQRDFDYFKDLFWSGFMPALVDRGVLDEVKTRKAGRRAYQRHYMRKVRAFEAAQRKALREGTPELAPVEAPKLDTPEVKSLEDLLGALPDDDELPQ